MLISNEPDYENRGLSAVIQVLHQFDNTLRICVSKGCTNSGAYPIVPFLSIDITYRGVSLVDCIVYDRGRTDNYFEEFNHLVSKCAKKEAKQNAYDKDFAALTEAVLDFAFLHCNEKRMFLVSTLENIFQNGVRTGKYQVQHGIRELLDLNHE